MKVTEQLILWGMILFSPIAWSKPAILVEAINNLDRQWSQTENLEVIPTGPSFFMLVMLEQLAASESAAQLGQLTQVDQWKYKTTQSSNRTGWSKLDSIWWLSSLEEPSTYAKIVTDHYRTALKPVEFHSREALESLPIGAHIPGQSIFDFESILYTQTEYSPEIPGGLSPAPLPSEFITQDGLIHPAQFIQTQIIPVQWYESGKNWLARIALSRASGWLTLGNLPPTNPDSLKWEELDAIIFLPQKSAESVFRPARHGTTWKSIVGPASAYDRVSEYSRLALNDWIIQSRVSFNVHQTPSPPHPLGKKIQPPKIIHLNRPFYYHIEGPQGETIFRGQISLTNIK